MKATWALWRMIAIPMTVLALIVSYGLSAPSAAAPPDDKTADEPKEGEGDKDPKDDEKDLTDEEDPKDDKPAAPKSFVKDGKLDVAAAVAYFEDLYRSDSSTAQATLTVTRPRSTRTMTMQSWTEGREKALIVITKPVREKGMATLKVGDNLWNYLPRIKRTIRIPPSMMLGSWMGSDFTNDDLVRESSYTDDYTYSVAGPSKDPEGWQIDFTAKAGAVGLWSKMELIVSTDGMLPVRARYYDRKNRLARTLTWSEIKEFDGRRIPSRMTLVPEDEDKKGQKTEMTYLEIDFDVKIPASTFSLTRLERSR